MFADLSGVVDRLDIPPGPHALTHLLAITDRLQARVSAAVGELDASGDYGLDGAISAQAWLTHHGRHARPAAHALIANARRLRTLPTVQTAWETGQISSDQARTIARTIDARVTDTFNTAAPELLTVLAPLSVRDIAYVCGVWNQHATAGLDDPPPPATTSGMHLNKTLDGTWHGDLTLDPDDGEIVDTALRQIIGDDPLTDSDGTPIRTMAERRADALVDLCRRYLDHQPARPGRRQRPHINVVLPVTALDAGPAGGIGGRYLTSSGPVTPGRVRELCCDANIHRVLTDSHSIILDHSAGERTVPPALFHTLEVRDHHCRYPGCDRPPAWCDGHHVVHWIDNGPTVLDNCVLLCRRHHRRCHEPGWRITLTPDGTVTITTATGNTLVSHAPLRQLALSP